MYIKNKEKNYLNLKKNNIEIVNGTFLSLNLKCIYFFNGIEIRFN